MTKITWIGDTGASCHMTNEYSTMFETHKISSPVKFGDGATMTATKIGKWKGTSYNKMGQHRMWYWKMLNMFPNCGLT